MDAENQHRRHRNPVSMRRRSSVGSRAKALEMYLCGGSTAQDIADACGVSPALINNWVCKGKWKERRMEIEAEVQHQLIARTTQFYATHRLGVLERHLEMGTKFEHHVDTRMKVTPPGAMLPRDLADLGKALQSGTQVTARAVGLDRQGVSVDINPNVNLLISTNLSPVPVNDHHKTITVRPEQESSDPF